VTEFTLGCLLYDRDGVAAKGYSITDRMPSHAWCPQNERMKAYGSHFETPWRVRGCTTGERSGPLWREACGYSLRFSLRRNPRPSTCPSR
jgi:hypothetical protein